MITVSELGALPRFDHPRQLMAYLGLVPSESTSSTKRRQGAIWLTCSRRFELRPAVPAACLARLPAARLQMRWLLIDHRSVGTLGGDCRRQPEGRDERKRARQCSQHYAMPPKVSKQLSHRQEGQPAAVLKTSWAAQNRLHRRLMRLLARRVHRNKALVAVARELTGFIWEALRDLPCYQAAPDAKQSAA